MNFFTFFFFGKVVIDQNFENLDLDLLFGDILDKILSLLSVFSSLFQSHVWEVSGNKLYIMTSKTVTSCRIQHYRLLRICYLGQFMDKIVSWTLPTSLHQLGYNCIQTWQGLSIKLRLAKGMLHQALILILILVISAHLG